MIGSPRWKMPTVDILAVSNLYIMLLRLFGGRNMQLTSLCLLIWFYVPSVQAFFITSPGSSQGWEIGASNQLQWNRVSTDPSSIDIILTNENKKILSQDTVLLTNVDASRQSEVIILPTNLTPGPSYRVNLNKGAAILAQSNEFDISSDQSSVTSIGGSSLLNINISTKTFATLPLHQSDTFVSETQVKTTSTLTSSSATPATQSEALTSKISSFTVVGQTSPDGTITSQVRSTETAETNSNFDPLLLEGVELTGFEFDQSFTTIAKC
ncbi:fruit-body specific D [Pyrrhoderma noxium]|uniref:Fruit-body specific D n=1 Tax=Pyrrhoderma noxium TaxID=2282107 RepID=A0A286UUX1_9AGAM|nr:fruit-body specific D [Pyrrhoderma noxium]